MANFLLRLIIPLLVSVLLPATAAAAGSFTSSDTLLDKIWAVSVDTAKDMVVRGPISTDAEGRSCPINLSTVIIDGAVRDRCPYVGDLAVSGKTLLISTASDLPALRGMILWFANNQHADGAIPAGAFDGGRDVLFDYNAFWFEDLYDYVLYTGDLGLASQVWPNLAHLLDGWYRAQANADGLLENSLGPADYAYIHREGPLVAYYNAGYVRALQQAGQIAAYGNTIADNDTWNAPDWGFQAGERAYPFMSYFEVLARYQAGSPDSALDLIRREWGDMVTSGPHLGMWEDIGPDGTPTDPWPSWEHGWSTGAAPPRCDRLRADRCER